MNLSMSRERWLVPLRCIDSRTGSNVLAFNLRADEWSSLRDLNRREQHLRTACCHTEVVLKKSKLGTQFFAHKVTGNCEAGPETEAHLRLKQIIAEVCQELGWAVETEAAGDTWRADVLATKGKARIAIEAQWSPQADAETMRRQERYTAAGIRCLWLFRQEEFPVSRLLPAVRILKDDDCEFVVILKTEPPEDRYPLREFLAHTLSKRFKFGVPLGVPARVMIYCHRVDCWSCGAESAAMERAVFSIWPFVRTTRIGDFDRFPDLAAQIWGWLPTSEGFGEFRRRSSDLYFPPYLSNSCHHCGAIFDGNEAVSEPRAAMAPIVGAVSVTARWRDFLLRRLPGGPAWLVFPE